MARNDSRPSRSSGGGRDGIQARQILDRFTEVDELLRDTNQTLQQVAQTQAALAGAIDAGTEQDLGVGDVESSEYPFDFSTAVPPGTTVASPVTEEFEVPYGGTLTEVVIGFPSGTQQAVGFGLDGPDGKRLVPQGPSGTRFIGFDNEVVRFGLNEPVEKERSFTVRFANNDPDNAHFVNVVLKLREDI